MKKKELEKYIRALAIDPKSKYLLVVSRESGLAPADLQELKLDPEFIDTMIMVDGEIDKVIASLPITRK